LFRPDAWRMGTLATAQWIAIGAFAVGFVGIIVNHLRPVKAEAEVEAEVKAETESPTQD
jgi:hypothetical protein